jgi:hypothetical protein
MGEPLEVEDLMFKVDVAPIEAVLGDNSEKRRIPVHHKKALLHAGTGAVLGVVSRDYRVVTNREAVKLAFDVCQRAFPGLSGAEWEPQRASAPSTLSYAFIDLMHKTHVLNYMDVGGSRKDPFTPFLRVTNSFNGARALRFDVGFMRKHCSNGVVFEEEVATIKAAHNEHALGQLTVQLKTRSLEHLWKEFSGFLDQVRGIKLGWPESARLLTGLLRPPKAREPDAPERQEGVAALAADFEQRLTGYRTELGENAYAVFNTLTDVAARPPDSPYFHKDRDTLEKRAGRWLRNIVTANQRPDFSIEKHLLEVERVDADRTSQPPYTRS